MLPLPRHRRPDAGFTLVEVLVAMSIFAVMLPATVGVVSKVTTGTMDNRSRVVAAGLAAGQLELVRGAATAASPALPVPNPASRQIGGRTYTITQSTAPVDAEGSTVTCSSSTLSGGLTRVSVSVAWTDMGNAHPARADTLVPGNTTGALALTVSGSSGQAVGGLPVTLTTPSGATLTSTTDTGGCAVFSGLAAGAYVAGLNSSGYVGRGNLQAVVSNPIAVAANAVTKATLQYDRAMSLATRYTVADDSAPVSAAQLAQIPAELKAGAATSTDATSSGSLVSGYLAPLYPAAYLIKGAAASQCTLASIDLSSGSPTSQTVDIPTADVKVSNWATLLAIGTIKAIYVGPASGSGDISCPVGTMVDTGTVFSITGDHRATLPLGNWKIQVPWNVFGSYPVAGLTVYCYPVTLTSSSTGVTTIDFFTWLATILLNPFNWFSGGC